MKKYQVIFKSPLGNTWKFPVEAANKTDAIFKFAYFITEMQDIRVQKVIKVKKVK